MGIVVMSAHHTALEMLGLKLIHRTGAPLTKFFNGKNHHPCRLSRRAGPP